MSQNVTNSQFHNWVHSSSSATGVFCCVFWRQLGKGVFGCRVREGSRSASVNHPTQTCPKKEWMKGWACWRHRDRGKVWVIGWHGKVTPKFKWKGENVLGAGREGRWFHTVWWGMMRFGGGPRVIIKWWERRWSTITGLPQPRIMWPCSLFPPPLSHALLTLPWLWVLEWLCGIWQHCVAVLGWWRGMGGC